MITTIRKFLSGNVRRLRKDEKGATAIEYGLIAALISVAIIVGAQALGGSLDTTFKNITACLDDASGGTTTNAGTCPEPGE